MDIKFTPPCGHDPENWIVDLSPTRIGKGFVLSVKSVVCKCGKTANITDARGVRLPATSLGVDFLSEAEIQMIKAGQIDIQSMPKAPPKILGEHIESEHLPPGPGTEMALELERLGMSSCQQCKGLAKLMNDWGPQGCRERLDEIVADVLPRARAWFDHATFREKLAVWWNSNQKLSTAIAVGTKASSWELDDALKEVIKVQVIAAIDRFEQKGNTL